MYRLFEFLVTVAIIMLFVSIFSPKLGTFKRHPEWSRKKAAGLWLAIAVAMSFLTTISTPEEVRTAQQQKTEQQKIEEEAKKQIFVKDYGFTIDQAKALNDALASVGLGKINAATKKGENDYVLDINATDTAYNPAKNIVHVFFDANNNVTAIKLRAIPLLQDGKVVHKISDYVISTGEEIDMKISAEGLIKKILKAPSTAKFDDETFKYFKANGELTIIGTVDSQNSFGAMVRAPFKITFIPTEKGLSPKYLMFEEQEFTF